MSNFKQEAAKVLNNTISSVENVAKGIDKDLDVVIKLSSNPNVSSFIPMLEQGAKLILGKYGIHSEIIEKAGGELLAFINFISTEAAKAIKKIEDKASAKTQEKLEDKASVKTQEKTEEKKQEG